VLNPNIAQYYMHLATLEDFKHNLRVHGVFWDRLQTKDETRLFNSLYEDTTTSRDWSLYKEETPLGLDDLESPYGVIDLFVVIDLDANHNLIPESL
jgi:hypothetical protein